MTQKHRVEQFMEELASKQNILAMAYLSLLQDASQEVKNQWYDQFQSLMEMPATETEIFEDVER